MYRQAIPKPRSRSLGPTIQKRSYLSQDQANALPESQKGVLKNSAPTRYQNRNTCEPDALELNRQITRNRYDGFDAKKHELFERPVPREEALGYDGPLVVTTSGNAIPKSGADNPYDNPDTHHSVNYQNGLILDQNPYGDEGTSRQWGADCEPRELAKLAPENFLAEVPQHVGYEVDSQGNDGVVTPELFRTHEVREKKSRGGCVLF